MTFWENKHLSGLAAVGNWQPYVSGLAAVGNWQPYVILCEFEFQIQLTYEPNDKKSIWLLIWSIRSIIQQLSIWYFWSTFFLWICSFRYRFNWNVVAGDYYLFPIVLINALLYAFVYVFVAKLPKYEKNMQTNYNINKSML